MENRLEVEKNENHSLIRVLLVEDNPGDARLVRETLIKTGAARFELTHVGRLYEGLRHLREGRFDVILLDLLLPDGTGFDTFVRAHTQVPEVPIIVLTGLDSEVLAVKAVREGAQDYLVKSSLDSNLLTRSIRYSIERHQLQSELRRLSIVDELTGLYNRRGFLTLGEQHLRLANRTNRGFLLVFADLDGLKQINDIWGHHEGDLALVQTANILKETFRSSDIVGRIGGDEFAVIMIEAHKNSAQVITARLQENLGKQNANGISRYRLSISIGLIYYDPESPCPVDELLSRADTFMYQHKLSKKVQEKRNEGSG